MLAAFMRFWMLAPDEVAREQLRSGIGAQLLDLDSAVLARIGRLLPLNAQRPYAELLAALSEWIRGR